MHALIHVHVLHVDMPVEMNDPDIAVDMRGDATNVRIA